MPLNNGNTVAAERRMDLASLFCMIGRHGPAVALAVIAMLSVLAGFIIYRTVTGKRRRATAAAADGDAKSPGAERDASVIREETRRSSAESTDVSDDSSSDMKEDVDVIQSDLKLRHRRAAAVEKTPPRDSPPERDIHIPDHRHTTSGHTEEVAVAWDSYHAADTYAQEAHQRLQSDADTAAAADMVSEDAVRCCEGESDEAMRDVLEEFHDNGSCLKEPINDEEKVLKAERQEDDDVTTDMTTRQEEDIFQCTLNHPVCFDQTPHSESENSGDDRLQDDKTTNGVESNTEEPVIDIEDVSVPCVCYGKDEEFENPEGNNRLSPEEERKSESEDQRLDHQLIGQQAEIWSTTCEQETHLQDDYVADKPAIRDSDWDEDGGPAGEEDIVEDHLNNVTAVKFDIPSPQFDEQDVEVEQKEEHGLTCDQEDGLLHDGDDQAEEKMLTGANVSCNEEQNRPGASLSPALTCSGAPEKADNHEDDLSGISGIADFADSSSDCQHLLNEEKTASSLEEDTSSPILGPEMPSHETENKPESNGNGTAEVSTEEGNDKVGDVPSCHRGQQGVQTLRSEAFDEASVAAAPEIVACDGENSTTPTMAEVFHEANVTADPDTVENIPSVIVEEIYSPHLPSICQDQQIDHVENNETSEETGFDTATDASWTSPPSLPDTMSSSQAQQSDQTKNNEDFSQATTGDSPVTINDINPPVCQIHLPSFEQLTLRDNDISLAGVGEESGISSMAVSPDAGNEFDMISENMVLPVMDYELPWEEKTETQNNLFADDAAISVIKDDTAGMVFGPYPSHRSQPTHREHTGWTNYESVTANEDTFGHEIEDSYHRAMDQIMAQIADSVASVTDELKRQPDMKDVVEVEEKKAGVSVEKKEEAKEKEKEEDYEKTEISIMEATMDHNEWIMDSNYQALPWMNLSESSFPQDHTETNQLPAAECQYSSAVTDTTSMDTDIPPSTEVKHTSTLSLVEENTMENKKVVAVQPMSQNVNVTFRVHYFTGSPHQTVAVTGNQQELGNWRGFVPLERAKDGHWATVVSLPAESHVEWKFVVVDKGEVCRWEDCGNRLLETGYGDDLLVHKWWGRL